ncbi:MAG TPA: carboxylating nicotinate-nucleotide diphosphorylase [Steroidobacteraceae bacterium]|nr:carboxylating nicotinate-nucleotide diphosphorylase [Steroidobacteraceae bacterium]
MNPLKSTGAAIAVAEPAVLPSDLFEQVARALLEDVGSGDVSAQLIPAERQGRAQVISREAAILCGAAWFDEVFRQLEPRIGVRWHFQDGAQVRANAVLCELAGPARALLTGERTALNFLQLLSATATVTARYVQAVAGTRCRILDTRKTIPGLRTAQKYAVRCGGGSNHRMGLYDMVLIKENHIAAAGSITAAVAAARQQSPGRRVEVETETLEQLREALDARADVVLLDNFSVGRMHDAVALNAAHAHPAQLEASGGVSLQTLREIAETGVDYISVGALTKHIAAIDLSMRFAS